MNAVLLAGGLGTRMREETEFRPKPMVEVGGRPVVLEVFTYVDQAVEPLVVSRRNAEGQFVSPSLADMDPPIEATHV
jgi:NDP-sugar pyrophosphorylase family protein